MYHICEECGRGFEASRSGERFCSQACKNRYYYRKNHISEAPREIRVCEECGKEFKPKTKRSRFCCRVCAERKRNRSNFYAKRNRVPKEKTSDQKAEG